MVMRKGRCLLGDGREVVATYSEETPEYPWVILIDGISKYLVDNNGVRPGIPKDDKTNVVQMLDNLLMIESGSKLLTEYGEMVVEAIYESSNGRNGGVTIYCEKPNAPALVIEIDKSNLKRWTNWIVMIKEGFWREFEYMPIVNDADCWVSPSGGRSILIAAGQAPKNVPVDRWRETLTEVPIQASDL